ncbi:MAG: CDP-diacylglycerol--glycerol-3-phosphate 3-phosphatidyltransferase [Desulfarculus sp.]|nr:CDP-diacylglycerol--glycerol-3-phosphate 3-phosphatidyltransferase [Desulfarculus sp.]
MEAAGRENPINLPNLLSLVRVGSIPILVGLVYLPGPHWSALAAGLFFVAGLTDLLDGWLARRMKKITVLGQYLDPVADKLLVASLLVVLTEQGRAPAWMTIIIVCREIGVTGLRALAASQRMTVPSDRWGKSKTALQMLGIFLLLLHQPVGGVEVERWGWYALCLAVVITAWSGLAYVVRFRRLLLAKQG